MATSKKITATKPVQASKPASRASAVSASKIKPMAQAPKVASTPVVPSTNKSQAESAGAKKNPAKLKSELKSGLKGGLKGESKTDLAKESPANPLKKADGVKKLNGVDGVKGINGVNGVGGVNGTNGVANGAALPAAATVAVPKTDTGLEKDLAKKPAGSLKSPLRIFQVYYESWQRDLLDPNFSGLDNSKSTSETKEFSVYEQLLSSDYVKDAQLWGALSWRFAEMTGMSGTDLIKSIQSHPGNDVYFCNPYPQNEALFHNGWQQGETTHPQFLAMAKAIFEVTGLPVEELTSISSSDLFSSTNFMVATPKFWQSYLPWVREVLSLANKKLPPKVRDFMHSKLADERNLHNSATYVPFIVERLFPVFMKTKGRNLKSYKIPLPERERELNVHLKLLREMKDVAYRTKSAWLAVCWANYRNLYFAQVNGKEWCDKYLRTITPTDIKFS